MNSLSKILVAADDLTGASELGAIALKHGLTSRIILGDEDPDQFREDVIIIDTDSRNLSPALAKEKLKKRASGIRRDEYSLIYKKVDSLLRGPVLSELEGFASGLGFESCILAPANPSLGRVVKGGKYFVNNIPLSQTEFSHDPDYPRLSDDVNELLLKETRSSAGPFYTRISVPDILSDKDLAGIAASSDITTCLAAGGADFFESLLGSVLKLKPAVAEFSYLLPGKKCFIIGSQSDSTKATKALLVRKDYKRITISGPAENKGDDSLRELILKEAKEGRNLMITLPDELISDRILAEKYYERLVKLAGQIIEEYYNSYTFLIEGGRTASGIFRMLGCSSLIVSSDYGGGATGLLIEGPRTEILIKPGSYKWPENILRFEN